MKKYILFFAGCLASLAMTAATAVPQKEHRVTLMADPDTGTATYTLRSTLKQDNGNPPYYRVFWKLENNRYDYPPLFYSKGDNNADPDTFDVTVPVGTDTFAVAATKKLEIAQAPQHRMPQMTEELPESLLPPAYEFWPEQYDIYYITVTPYCESGLVYTKWDDFLFVDNGVNGGNGEFVAYQWYKDGAPIAGATEQWLRTTLSEGAMPSGEYHAVITDKDGNSLSTCPATFNSLPRSQTANPHSAKAAPANKIIRDGKLFIRVGGEEYNARGQRVP